MPSPLFVPRDRAGVAVAIRYGRPCGLSLEQHQLASINVR